MKSNIFKSILILITLAISLSFLGPFSVRAQVLEESPEILALKKQILELQIEILKMQIALLLEQGGSGTVLEKDKCAQLVISWEQVKSATAYRLYRDSTLVYEGSARTFTDTNLVLNKKYRYTVYAVYRGEQGEASEVKEVTAPSVCPPKTPTLSFNSSTCGGQITVSWTSVYQATVYQLMRGAKEIYYGAFNKFVDSGLVAGASYQYKIRSGNTGGWSEFSNLVSFTASKLCAPSTPEIETVLPDTDKEGELSISMNSSPINNLRVRPNAKNQGVMSFTLGAQYSDINLARLDLFFDKKVWLYLDSIGIQHNNRSILQKEIKQADFTRFGDTYRLRLEDVQVTVKEGGNSTITVVVSTKKEQPEDLPINLTVFLEQDAIRASDGAGIIHFVPFQNISSFKRTFVIY